MTKQAAIKETKTDSILCKMCLGDGQSDCFACGGDGTHGCDCGHEHKCTACNGESVLRCVACAGTGHRDGRDARAFAVYQALPAKTQKAILAANAFCWAGYPSFHADGRVCIAGKFTKKFQAVLKRAAFEPNSGINDTVVWTYKHNGTMTIDPVDLKRFRAEVEEELKVIRSVQRAMGHPRD